jgi:hypothetical protein
MLIFLHLVFQICFVCSSTTVSLVGVCIRRARRTRGPTKVCSSIVTKSNFKSPGNKLFGLCRVQFQVVHQFAQQAAKFLALF